MLILPSQKKKTGKILSSRKPKNDEAILHIFELSKQNVTLELFGFQFRKTGPKTNFFPLENFIIKFITNLAIHNSLRKLYYQNMREYFAFLFAYNFDNS